MVVVAVAGGTGGVGRAIVEAIQAQAKHTVLVLSRSANEKFESKHGTKVLALDYVDVDKMATTLRSHDVHTIISTLKVATSGDPQVNLVKAAALSTTVRRFAPSVWGIPFNKARLEGYPTSKFKYQAVQQLEKTSLEYTLFYNGFFLDYLGYPHLKTYLQPATIVIDMTNNTAGIPGDGNTLVTFTYSFDVAKFVAASLDLPVWEKESYVIGDRMTLNEYVKLAEEAKGIKFSVSYDSLDTLKEGKVTELPAHQAVYKFLPKEKFQAILAVLGRDIASGVFALDTNTKTLNSQFPEISPVTVRDMLKLWQ